MCIVNSVGIIFCMITFVSSRQCSELILEILSNMLDRPKERDRATPIFRYKKRMNIFP